MVGVVDFGGSGAVGPGESAGVGDCGVPSAVGDLGVVGSAGEVQHVGVGGAAGGPVQGVVDLAVVAGLKAIWARAAAVAGVADDALVGGGDPFLAAQIDRAVAVVVEHRQVVDGVGWPS